MAGLWIVHFRICNASSSLVTWWLLFLLYRKKYVERIIITTYDLHGWISIYDYYISILMERFFSSHRRDSEVGQLFLPIMGPVRLGVPSWTSSLEAWFNSVTLSSDTEMGNWAGFPWVSIWNSLLGFVSTCFTQLVLLHLTVNNGMIYCMISLSLQFFLEIFKLQFEFDVSFWFFLKF